MKLTSHQKEIVDKIISGEVFDIPSYLRTFGKGHEQQYDLNRIQATFEEHEGGKTHIFREASHNFYTDVYDSTGKVSQTLPILNQMTYPLRDTPMDSPAAAQLDNKLTPEQVHWKGKTYYLNFLAAKHLVADSFADIRDFVALWSYLSREALIFVGKKTVEEEDFSVFFELIGQKVEPVAFPRWKQENVPDFETKKNGLPTLHSYMIPEKPTNPYITDVWKLNQENLAMCEDFVGVKMMATSELVIYQQKGYKTVEERSQRNSLWAAWAAVIVSLVAVLIGNIFPLFQKADSDYLNQISQQIASIENRIDRDNSSQEIIAKLDEIHADVTLLMDSLEQQPLSELLSEVEDIYSQIANINHLLQETPNEEP